MLPTIKKGLKMISYNIKDESYAILCNELDCIELCAGGIKEDLNGDIHTAEQKIERVKYSNAHIIYAINQIRKILPV